MATTRIIAMHTNKGKTIAQTLKDRTDYGMNPDKTDGGELVTAYVCDAHTVDAEFLLSKREYLQLTGRKQDNDVIAYQVRQSFKPGEITPEEAHKVGYEFATRFLKGKHAFIVCTHTDKKHIHNHIIWNSTTLDCKHKFRDFRGSWRAVSRLSDLLCISHQLSVVQQPTRYAHTHYGKWLGNRAKPSNREQLRIAIDEALSRHPHTFDAFWELLRQDGYIAKPGKQLALCKEGQKAIRLDSLKDGYTEDDIRAVIAGQKQHRPRKKRSTGLSENIQRVIDLETVRARDKGIAYARWATNFNSNAASKSLLYLQTNYDGSYEKLAQAADEMSARSRALSGQMAAAQKRLEEIDILRRHILNYAHTREAFQQYKASGYSKKFLEEHLQEIETHRASKRAFNELGLKKLPSKKALDAEYSQVLAEKKSLYAAYCEEQRKLKEILVHQENLRPYLAPQEPQTQKRKEQDER